MPARPILRTARLAGDLITALPGKPFYITSSRYRSMGTDYVTPMDKTHALLGPPKVLPSASPHAVYVRRADSGSPTSTVTWLRTQPEYTPTP